MIIVNAENKILGRLATYVAKQALLGNKVVVVNSEKAIITGNRDSIFKHYKKKYDRGTFKGPFLHRHSDRIVKRTIRGMLPYKQPKGRKAYENIKCYVGIPEEFKGKEYLDLKDAEIPKSNNVKFITVKEVSRFLGGKI